MKLRLTSRDLRLRLTPQDVEALAAGTDLHETLSLPTGQITFALVCDGTEIGATRGLLRSLNAFMNQGDATHVAVAFDHVIESFRNDLFDGYKTGEGMDPDLYAQFPLAEEGCRALGLVVWPMISDRRRVRSAAATR